jgi:hypothetical protein
VDGGLVMRRALIGGALACGALVTFAVVEIVLCVRSLKGARWS